MKKLPRLVLVFCFAASLLLSFLCLTAQTEVAPASLPASQPASASRPGKIINFERFIADIHKFEKKDKESFPAPGGTLFVGSSTFRLWTQLEEDFKDFHAINRGFGGSTMPEVLYYMDRIVLPYKPGVIVVYAGTNDLAGGRSAQQLTDDFKAFVERTRKTLPDVLIYCIPPNPSPARDKWADEFAKAGTLLQEYVSKTPGLYFIDPRPFMKDANGQHRYELYLKDKLHMNRQGYELWIPLIRKALKEKTSVTAPSPSDKK